MRLHRPAARAARKTRSAFTLLEILIVVSIIVVLAGTGYYYFMARGQEAKADVTKAKIDALITICDQFYTKHNRFPTSLDELKEKVEDQATGTVTAPYVKSEKALLDGWNNRLGYTYTADMAQPEIFCQTPGYEHISSSR